MKVLLLMQRIEDDPGNVRKLVKAFDCNSDEYYAGYKNRLVGMLKVEGEDDEPVYADSPEEEAWALFEIMEAEGHKVDMVTVHVTG